MQLDFNNSQNKIYVIDTSALIMLDFTFKYENPVFTAIWEEIEDLIGSGLFRTIDFVEEEISNYEGKDEADPYLIAYCKVHNCILITNENKNKPNKIPKIAEKFGVDCIDIYDFLLHRGLRMERKKK